MLPFNNLIGIASDHIDFDCSDAQVHSELIDAIGELKINAANEGIDFKIASAYRSFDRQLKIWNAKAEGLRPLLGVNGEAIAHESLSEEQLLHAILRWSALPGASRHHWGTELDVFDANMFKNGEKLLLTHEETIFGGTLFEFHQWLTAYLKKNDKAFFRPYLHDKGGVAPEAWHLSYLPLAQQFYQTVCSQAYKDFLFSKLESEDLLLKDFVLKNFDEIFNRYVCNIN